VLLFCPSSTDRGRIEEMCECTSETVSTTNKVEIEKQTLQMIKLHDAGAMRLH